LETVESHAILSQIIAILERESPGLRGVGLVADTPLMSTGLLDSFTIVTVLSALERTFSVDFDVATIDFEQLETPATIARLCEDAGARRGPAAGG
jgi:acyl carrier protein